MKKVPKEHAWFMAHSNTTKGGVRLVVRPEYGNKAYIGEYRWGADYGINTRWQVEKYPHESQYFHGFDSEKDVEAVVNESFAYCLQVKKFLENKS